MKFVKINTRVGACKKTKSVRCAFFKTKSNSKGVMCLKISTDLLEKLGFDLNKKVDFYLNEDNKKIWLIKQDETSKGYKLSRISNSTYAVNISVDYFYISNVASKTKELKYDFYDGGLRIYYED